MLREELGGRSDYENSPTSLIVINCLEFLLEIIRKLLNLFFCLKLASSDEWVVNKPSTMCIKTNSSSYDGRLSLPVICVSVNLFSLRRTKAMIVPRICHGDSFGISPAGHTEVTVVLILICASENCRTGSDPWCLLLSVFSGWWNFSVLIRPVVNWWGVHERMSMTTLLLYWLKI